MSDLDSFLTWLDRAKLTNDFAGDFVGDARHDKDRIRRWFEGSQLSRDGMRGYLQFRHACPQAQEGFSVAWRRYRTWAKG